MAKRPTTPEIAQSEVDRVYAWAAANARDDLLASSFCDFASGLGGFMQFDWGPVDRDTFDRAHAAVLHRILRHLPKAPC